MDYDKVNKLLTNTDTDSLFKLKTYFEDENAVEIISSPLKIQQQQQKYISSNLSRQQNKKMSSPYPIKN